MRIMKFAGRLSRRIIARYASVLMDGHTLFLKLAGSGPQEVPLRPLDGRGKSPLVVLLYILEGRNQVQRDSGYYGALPAPSTPRKATMSPGGRTKRSSRLQRASRQCSNDLNGGSRPAVSNNSSFRRSMAPSTGFQSPLLTESAMNVASALGKNRASCRSHPAGSSP